MLKHEETVFLDGLTLEDVEKALKVKITVVEPTGEGIIKKILEAHVKNGQRHRKVGG
jgi:NifB/MoaA-like Fe-S oxidoreductase